MISLTQQIIKEKKRRIQYQSSELKRRYVKLMKIQATNLGYIPLQTLPKIRLKNYCLISGSARSVYSKHFRLSRHQIKKFFKYLTSLRNSSW